MNLFIAGGAGGLTKQGEATLTLGNGSDFTGAANINEGTLTVSGELATNTINVAEEATLTTTAADLLSATATVTADGTLNLGGDQTLNNLLGADTGWSTSEPATCFSPGVSTSRAASTAQVAASRPDRVTSSSEVRTPSPATWSFSPAAPPP